MKKYTILSFLLVGLAGCVGIEQYPTNSYSDATFWNYEDNCMAADPRNKFELGDIFNPVFHIRICRIADKVESGHAEPFFVHGIVI